MQDKVLNRDRWGTRAKVQIPQILDVRIALIIKRAHAPIMKGAASQPKSHDVSDLAFIVRKRQVQCLVQIATTGIGCDDIPNKGSAWCFDDIIMEDGD